MLCHDHNFEIRPTGHFFSHLSKDFLLDLLAAMINIINVVKTFCLQTIIINCFIKDAVRDGIRSIKNALDDGCVVPGAGAFEVAVHVALKKAMEELKGRERLGMQAYADAMLVIPKVLAVNAGNFLAILRKAFLSFLDSFYIAGLPA